MEPRVLTGRNQCPGQELIFSHLGRRRSLWDALSEFIHTEPPDFADLYLGSEGAPGVR